MQRLPTLCLAASILALPACTGLEPALIGAAVTGAQTGVTLLEGGEMRSFELARFEDVVAAAERAADSLGLERVGENRAEDRVWFNYRYDDDRRLRVEILRRTDRVTSIQASVRKKKHRGMAALYLRDLFHELREADAYLEDWRAEDEPIADPG